MLFQRIFEERFQRVRAGYHGLLRMARSGGWVFVGGFMAFVLGSFALVRMLGSNFFPAAAGG